MYYDDMVLMLFPTWCLLQRYIHTYISCGGNISYAKGNDCYPQKNHSMLVKLACMTILIASRNMAKTYCPIMKFLMMAFCCDFKEYIWLPIMALQYTQRESTK